MQLHGLAASQPAGSIPREKQRPFHYSTTSYGMVFSFVVPSQPRRLSKSKRQGWQFPKIEFSKKTQKSLVGSQENRTFALAKTK